MTDNYWTPKFTIVFAALFIVFYAAMFLSAHASYMFAATPEGVEAANTTRQQVETMRLTVTVQNIFLNNLQVSLILFFPLIGVFSFLTVLINTGTIIGLLASTYGIHPFLYITNISVPVGLIEISAFTFLAAENIYLVYLTVARSGAVDRLKRQSWKSLLFYIALLSAGAIIEVILIG